MVRLRKTMLVLAAVVLLSGCDSGKEQPVVQVSKKQAEGIIIALGDSLTAGLGVDPDRNYPAQLQKRLEAEGYSYRVVNAGVSGETSSGTLSRLNWILGQNPDIVILETGANDGLRGIDTTLVEKNLKEILQILKEKEVVIVLTGMEMVKNMGDRYTLAFNQMYPRIAKEAEVIFMPFFLEGVAAVQVLNNTDGIHPNENGYTLITENIFPYVAGAIEKHRALRQKN
jgi:acyl-CoA thioesterase-1